MYRSFFLLVWQCCVASLSVITLKIFTFPIKLTFIFLLLCRHSSLLQVKGPSCCNLLIPFKTLVNGATSSCFLILLLLPHYEEKWAITIHRRIKHSLYFTSILWLFVLRHLANLQHFLIGTFSFLENTLCLAAHVESARSVQVSRCRTKLGGCKLTANYIHQSVFAI